MIALAAFSVTGCRSGAYYSAMDMVGKERRSILADRVQDAREDQVQARTKLEGALSTLRRVENAPVNELETLKNQLSANVDDARGEVNDLAGSTEGVQSVARSMFEEWEKDLTEMEDADLRQRSAAELRSTRSEVNRLVATLQQTHQKLSAAIQPLQDHVLFLENQLRAGSMPEETRSLQELRQQISTLLEDLDASIDRTERFIEGREATA